MAKVILGTSTMSYKHQVTIPKKAVVRFKIEEGETLVFLEEEGKLILRKGTEE